MDQRSCSLQRGRETARDGVCQSAEGGVDGSLETRQLDAACRQMNMDKVWGGCQLDTRDVGLGVDKHGCAQTHPKDSSTSNLTLP